MESACTSFIDLAAQLTSQVLEVRDLKHEHHLRRHLNKHLVVNAGAAVSGVSLASA